MKILITGGAGFIGSHLVDACVLRGDIVYVLDNLSTGLLGNIQSHIVEGNISFREADIRDAEKMQEIFAEIQPDLVFHLAAQINVRESIRNPAHDVEVNILGTLNILEAMRKNGCKRIIFSSTGGAMFGGDNPPYKENQEAHPETPYGISKRSVELLLEFYQRQYGIEPTMLRYANVYGPRQNAEGEAGVVSIFLDKIQKNEQPTIFGDGSQTRDFIHVADVVTANTHAYEKNLTGMYHVGT
jgi:UDP-glucose 4-epimerase